MSDGGKGSNPRPYSVDQKTFGDNWDAIFGKKNKKPEIEWQELDKVTKEWAKQTKETENDNL